MDALLLGLTVARRLARRLLDAYAAYRRRRILERDWDRRYGRGPHGD
jgi:hypothetical protein